MDSSCVLGTGSKLFMWRDLFSSILFYQKGLLPQTEWGTGRLAKCRGCPEPWSLCRWSGWGFFSLPTSNTHHWVGQAILQRSVLMLQCDSTTEELISCPGNHSWGFGVKAEKETSVQVGQCQLQHTVHFLNTKDIGRGLLRGRPRKVEAQGCSLPPAL